MHTTEDEEVFGFDRWVYCKQHGRPHMTGWCTAPASEKILLEARNEVMARLECKEKGYTQVGE